MVKQDCFSGDNFCYSDYNDDNIDIIYIVIGGLWIVFSLVCCCFTYMFWDSKSIEWSVAMIRFGLAFINLVLGGLLLAAHRQYSTMEPINNILTEDDKDNLKNFHILTLTSIILVSLQIIGIIYKYNSKSMKYNLNGI